MARAAPPSPPAHPARTFHTESQGPSPHSSGITTGAGPNDKGAIPCFMIVVLEGAASKDGKEFQPSRLVNHFTLSKDGSPPPPCPPPSWRQLALLRGRGSSDVTASFGEPTSALVALNSNPARNGEIDDRRIRNGAEATWTKQKAMDSRDQDMDWQWNPLQHKPDTTTTQHSDAAQMHLWTSAHQDTEGSWSSESSTSVDRVAARPFYPDQSPTYPLLSTSPSDSTPTTSDRTSGWIAPTPPGIRNPTRPSISNRPPGMLQSITEELSPSPNVGEGNLQNEENLRRKNSHVSIPKLQKLRDDVRRPQLGPGSSSSQLEYCQSPDLVNSDYYMTPDSIVSQQVPVMSSSTINPTIGSSTTPQNEHEAVTRPSANQPQPPGTRSRRNHRAAPSSEYQRKAGTWLSPQDPSAAVWQKDNAQELHVPNTFAASPPFAEPNLSSTMQGVQLEVNSGRESHSISNYRTATPRYLDPAEMLAPVLESPITAPSYSTDRLQLYDKPSPTVRKPSFLVTASTDGGQRPAPARRFSLV